MVANIMNLDQTAPGIKSASDIFSRVLGQRVKVLNYTFFHFPVCLLLCSKVIFYINFEMI